MIKENDVIYQVFVRNYSKEGTFKKVTEDLERIASLGVDILYLMPIHEIGNIHRKGKYGSPYATKDYYSISPDLGTLNDLKDLINKSHYLGMKVILDLVFNHTAPDCVLVKEHPEFYYKKDGKFANRIGEWSDIIDLDTFNEKTQDYLANVVAYWVTQGFDGFRFDVASLISLDVFKKARKLVGNDIIFLAESIDKDFNDYVSSQGLYTIKDKDLYPVFDATYNYNWFRHLINYLKDKDSLERLVDELNKDNEELNEFFFRANCLENHDNERIASLVVNDEQLKNLIQLQFFLKGNPFIYAGQEYGIKNKPALFEKDPINWNNKDENMFKLYQDLIYKKKLRSHIVSQDVLLKKGTSLEVVQLDSNNVTTKEVFKL